MTIRTVYDPILRTATKPVTVFDASLKKAARQMIEAMRAYGGMGLAANQVGLNQRLLVIERVKGSEDDLPKIPLIELCNPRIVKWSKEKETMIEACLSLPGLELPVTRSVGVVVAAQDLTGKLVKMKAKGLLARILQHEIDHLDGLLFPDRVKDFRRPDSQDLRYFQWAKIVFFGSDDFSAEIFAVLRQEGLNVIAVITETDKPANRGRQLTPPILKELSSEAAVAVFQPETKEEITTITRQLAPDLIVLASYGKILPLETLSIPVYGALNVHPSLLPKYRGPTPIQSAILAGELQTGVTLMVMDEKVDTGPIVNQVVLPIEPTDTALTLRQKLARRGAELLIKQLPSYLAGQASLRPQVEAEASVTNKLTKEMALIDWAKPIDQLDREIRAFHPWPGSFTWLNGERLKILTAQRQSDCLKLLVVQLEGRKASNWADFVRGHHQQLTKTDWYSKICKTC